MQADRLFRKGTRLLALACLAFTGAASSHAQDHPVRARYLVLTTRNGTPPPFASLDLVLGPEDQVDDVTGRWWQLEARKEAEQSATPLFQLRCFSPGVPPVGAPQPTGFLRYVLHLPATGERLDYRNRHTDRALLPSWTDFSDWFVPHATAASRCRDGIPETCTFLGHVLTLHGTGRTDWEEWPEPELLRLDPELLVGTSRNFKDREGHRLPQKPERRNYDYVRFEEADYPVMIEAGINLFRVDGEQERWVRDEPVFYVRPAAGESPLHYPADLYRPNYLGPVMYMDEPSILMVGDTNIHNTLRYFSDAAALIKLRTRNTYFSDGSYGAYSLERQLREHKENLGAMRLMQWDYPSWETLHDTAFYQMKGGGAGIVHEGRYQPGDFDKAVRRFTEEDRKHTGEELLAWHYAFLRGGARAFGKDWGTAIYGQCDTNLAPLAVTRAYDMGARYVWFWTSDHDHHVPWPEQLSLARALQDHARNHPRPSIRKNPVAVDTAIAIPNGSFISLENLWWVRELDRDGKNEASQHYRRLVRRVIEEAHKCFEEGRSFDITVDEGRPIEGYRRVVRVNDAP